MVDRRRTLTGRAEPPVSDLVGVLNVRKESGWTSHDVVARLRRIAGQRRIGHAGTLDPMAEGVLPVLMGRATRLVQFLGSAQKRYFAEIQLGSATSTDDAEGPVVAEACVPPLSETGIQEALTQFRGEIRQVPPAYSAIKVGGQRSYKLARRGEAPDLAARTVTIYQLDLAWRRDDVLAVDIACSAGTYVRALARDLAQALGTRGHLRGLVRTEVGPFRIENALTVEEIQARGVANVLQPPDLIVSDLPSHHVDATTAEHLCAGRAVCAPGLRAVAVRVYDPAGRLVAIGSADGEVLHPRICLVTAVPASPSTPVRTEEKLSA